MNVKLFLTDISDYKLQQAKETLQKEFPEGKIPTHLMDVSNLISIESVANLLRDKNIEIGILINNAAIDPKLNSDNGITETSRLENFNKEQWDSQIAVRLQLVHSYVAKYLGQLWQNKALVG